MFPNISTVKRSVLILAAVVFHDFVADAGAADISGTARVIDARTMEVAGHKLRLFGIAPPAPGQVCRWPNKDIPCGRIAATALMDLVFTATVVCRRNGRTDTDGVAIATCRADGFDVGRNMVHTGWARAVPDLEPSYVPVERAAEKAKRGVWRGGPSGWIAR